MGCKLTAPWKRFCNVARRNLRKKVLFEMEARSGRRLKVNLCLENVLPKQDKVIQHQGGLKDLKGSGDGAVKKGW